MAESVAPSATAADLTNPPAMPTGTGRGAVVLPDAPVGTISVKKIADGMKMMSPAEHADAKTAVPGLDPSVVPHRYGDNANDVTNPRGEGKEGHNKNPVELAGMLASRWNDHPTTCRITGAPVTDLDGPPPTSAQVRRMIYMLAHDRELRSAFDHRINLSYAANRHLHDTND